MGREGKERRYITTMTREVTMFPSHLPQSSRRGHQKLRVDRTTLDWISILRNIPELLDEELYVGECIFHYVLTLVSCNFLFCLCVPVNTSTTIEIRVEGCTSLKYNFHCHRRTFLLTIGFRLSFMFPI